MVPRVGASPFPAASFPFPLPSPDSRLPRDAWSLRTHSAEETAGPGAGETADPSRLPPPRESCTPAGKKGSGGRVRMWRGGREPAGRRAEAARCPGGGPAAGRRAKAEQLSEGRRRRRRRPSSARRGRVSGERRPAPRSASSRLADWQPGGRSRAFSARGWHGVGGAARGRAARLRQRAFGWCSDPTATRAPCTWGAAARGRGRRPGRAWEGAGRVCGKFEAGRETPGR